MGLIAGAIYKMTEKYLLFSLEDEESRKLGEVISNPTCKKIVNLLAEKELSENDVATELKIPLNTVDYNIKKLLAAGIIEKSKNFFWSVKGRRIENYRVANKLIVISPKKSNIYSKLKGILPATLICGILTLFIAWYYRFYNSASYIENKVLEGNIPLPSYSQDLVSGVASSASGISLNVLTSIQTSVASSFWLWFLAGALVAIITFLAWNWKKL